MAQLDAPRPLGSVEISELRSAILAQPSSFWDLDADIKRIQAPRRDGKMVWLWRNENHPEGPRCGPGSALSFFQLVAPLISQLLESYPPGGQVVSAMFPLLPPGGVILPHRDVAPFLVNSHRIHIPLVLNSGVEFHVEGQPVPLDEGGAFELPNQLLHSVSNRGAEDRIHFIFDYMPRRRSAGGTYAWLPPEIAAELS